MGLFGRGRGLFGLPKKPNWKWVSIILAIIYVAYANSEGLVWFGLLIALIIFLLVRRAK